MATIPNRGNWFRYWWRWKIKGAAKTLSWKFETFLCEIKVFNHMQTKSCTKKGFALIFAYSLLRFHSTKLKFLLNFSFFDRTKSSIKKSPKTESFEGNFFVIWSFKVKARITFTSVAMSTLFFSSRPQKPQQHQSRRRWRRNEKLNEKWEWKTNFLWPTELFLLLSFRITTKIPSPRRRNYWFFFIARRWFHTTFRFRYIFPTISMD